MFNIKQQKIVIKAGLILWTIWVIANYFIHHPSHFYAINEPPYLSTIVTLIILSTGLFFWYQKKLFKLRGWMFYIFVLLCMLIIFHNFAREASIYTEPIPKHQFYFLVNNLMLHLGCVLIFSICYAIGQLFLKSFADILDVHSLRIVSVALGIALLTLLLMVLAGFNILQTWVIIPILIPLMIWQRKAFWSFLKFLFWNPIDVKLNSKWTFAWITPVLFFIAFNLVGAMKIFPIGFDSTSLYQNTSKILFDSHHLVPGGQAYNWSLFTSIGPLLFGKMSFSILLSHVMGVLCIWAMYHLGRIFLNASSVWLAIAIFYTLPALGYHNFGDAKVDLGFLFISLSTFLLLLKYGASIKYDFSIWNKKSMHVFALIGVLLGFAMGIKYLTILLLIGFISMLFYQWGGIKIYFGTFLLMLAVLFLGKINNFGYLEITNTERYSIISILVFSGIAVLLYSYKQLNWKKGIGVFKNVTCLLFVFILTFSPWMIKNAVETKSISTKTLLYGKSSRESLKINYAFLKKNNIPFKISPKDKQIMRHYLEQKEDVIDLDDLSLYEKWEAMASPELRKQIRANFIQKNKTGKREEIQRYLGYESGLPKYISLTYDLTMNTNIRNRRMLDIGFLFLLFLPLLFLSLKKKTLFTFKNTLLILSFGLILLISWKAVLNNGNGEKTTETHLSKYTSGSNQLLKTLGEDIYLPILNIQDTIADLALPIYAIFSKMNFPFSFFSLIFLSVVFSFGARDNWRKLPVSLKLLMIFTISYGFLWWILGNGITYYALIIWLLLSLVIVFYFKKIDLFIRKDLQGFFNKWFRLIVGLFLFFNLLVHFSNQANDWGQMKNIFFVPFLSSFSTSVMPDNADLEKSIPINNAAINILNKDQEVKIYRVGTFLNYHIDNNHLRVYEDNQLGMFNRVYGMLQNPDDFIKVLKLSGFKYIVFNLKVANIDQTPEKTLVDKALKLVQVLNNKERIRLVITDNIVRRVDPNTKQEKEGYGLRGELVKPGGIAVFEIL